MWVRAVTSVGGIRPRFAPVECNPPRQRADVGDLPQRRHQPLDVAMPPSVVQHHGLRHLQAVQVLGKVSSIRQHRTPDENGHHPNIATRRVVTSMRTRSPGSDTSQDFCQPPGICRSAAARWFNSHASDRLARFV